MQNPYLVLKAANRLPTPPGVAMRILQLVEAEETSLDDLAQVIGSDPALTSKLLKYMSSPLVGLGFHGSTLPEAVARIGMRGTQMLALSFSLVTDKHRDACPSFHFDRFWSESLARAVAARAFAAHLAGWDPEEAFISGLLCRIGLLVLSTGMPEDYEPILSGRIHGDLPLEERERRVLGLDHLEVGMHLLKDWRLPEIVWRTPVRLFSAEPSERHVASARIIGLADVTAHFLLQENQHNAEGIRRLAAQARERLEIDGDAFRTLLGQIGQDWISYGRLLSVPTPQLPALDAIERQAEEQRTALHLATEIEVQHLRSENEQLAQRARHDRLTGLLSRSAFDDALPAALQKARQELHSLALLLIDVDRFKNVNDAHGRAAGDAVLEHLARLVDDHVRKHDEVFRFGGDELAVLAPECPREAAAALAEALLDTVRSTRFEHEGHAVALTVSIGLAVVQWPDRPAGPEGMIAWAEQRLYDAREAGGDGWRLDGPGRGLLSRVRSLFTRERK